MDVPEGVLGMYLLRDKKDQQNSKFFEKYFIRYIQIFIDEN